jgi:hypothetical protein
MTATKEKKLPKSLVTLGQKVLYYWLLLRDEKKGKAYLDKFEAKCEELGLDGGQTLMKIKNTSKK